MMVALAHPGLFWTGLGLVSVPILIHLFFRRRHRVVRWAAMRFLLAALKKQKRRMEVENLILLLLRCAAILLLGVAVARPAVEAAGLSPFGGGARAVVLILDTSTSMDARHTARSSLERAKERAGRFVTQLPDGSKVTLVVSYDDSSGGAPRALLENASPAEAKVRIPGVRLGHGPNDLGMLLRLASEKLAALRGRRLVVFLTDLQRRDWYTLDGNRQANVYQALRSLDRDEEDDPTPVTILDIGQDETDNVAVSDLTIDAGRQAFAGKHLGVTASVSNFGRAPAKGTLTLFMANGDSPWEQVPDPVEISVDASLGFGAAELFTWEFLPRMPANGPVRLKAVFRSAEAKGADRLALDSERYLALRVRPPVRILPVRSFRKAIEILRDVELLDVIDLAPEIYPADLAEIDLSGIDILLWADAEAHGLSPEDAGKIEEFVRRGGGLLLYLGRYTRADVFNRYFFREKGGGLLPVELGEWRSDPEHPVYFELDDDATQRHPLFEDTRKFFFSPEVVEYRRLNGTPPGVIARYDDGATAVFEHAFHRGRVVAITTTPYEGGFRLNGSLLPAILFFNAAHYLVWEDPGFRNVLVGRDVTIPLPTGTREVTVVPPQAAGGVIEEPVEEGKREFVLTGTTYPGFYRITAKGVGASARPTEVAVDATANLDPAESDLRRATPAQLKQDYQGVPLHFTDEVETILPRASAGDEGDASRALLGVVVFILLLELLLAWRFGSRRRATA